MKICFVDKNRSLVKKVTDSLENFPRERTDIEQPACADIFTFDGVIVSASNPEFTMAGGLDYHITQHFRDDCNKIITKDGNQRHGKVIFTVTVGEDLKATRELVAKALKFALKNTKENETVLISGLGTGIGGLDEDDFVWLFVAALCEHYGYGWGIKYLKMNNTDHYTGKIKYEVGRWLEVLGAPKNGKACDVGLHLGKSFQGAGTYNIPESIMFCLYENKDICGQDDHKVRISRLLPLYQMNRWMGYGPNGKKVLKKLDKKFDAKKYNPYTATKLPPKAALIKLAQVGSQVRAQVWDQVGAVSYWAINIHFELGVSHWFFDFLSHGIMPIFVNGKIKVFGKKGEYLGEYDIDEVKNAKD